MVLPDRIELARKATFRLKGLSFLSSLDALV
jgi:hypothetical protein